MFTGCPPFAGHGPVVDRRLCRYFRSPSRVVITIQPAPAPYANTTKMERALGVNKRGGQKKGKKKKEKENTQNRMGKRKEAKMYKILIQLGLLPMGPLPHLHAACWMLEYHAVGMLVLAGLLSSVMAPCARPIKSKRKKTTAPTRAPE